MRSNFEDFYNVNNENPVFDRHPKPNAFITESKGLFFKRKGRIPIFTKRTNAIEKSSSTTTFNPDDFDYYRENYCLEVNVANGVAIQVLKNNNSPPNNDCTVFPHG